MGFVWNFSDPMTFKVIECNMDPNKQNIIVHRGIVIPRTLTAAGYNSALAPRSDAYFPDF